MAIISEKHKLAYFSVPKVASTSLKRFVFEIEHGKPYSKELGGGQNIHRVYPTLSFDPSALSRTEGYWRFTVLRDPIERILSAWRNRIFADQELQKSWKSRRRSFWLRLPINPSLDEFCEKLVQYRKHPGVRHHTELIHAYLGPSLSPFDGVFRIEDIAELQATLRKRTGKHVMIPHAKRSSGTKCVFEDLSSEAKRALRQYTNPEYEMLNGLYEPLAPFKKP